VRNRRLILLEPALTLLPRERDIWEKPGMSWQPDQPTDRSFTNPRPLPA
jgi:hypothetical protein